MKKLLFLSIITLVCCYSCDDRDDNIFTPNAELEVQDFIWKGMNLYYFWQEDVPDLADDRFSSDEEYENYLSQYPDPAVFFNHLLFTEDRFSFITDNYEELQNSQQGNSNSAGVEFGLRRRSEGSNDIFGYVRYIIPNSDASTKNIQRGDIFVGVDGQNLTIGNYQELLFGANNDYTLNMGEITTDNSIVANGESVALTKTSLTENPVFINKTFTINGQQIGYLMYNRFTANFDDELNNAFAQFKTDGITDLILDMRYNPGGSVNSSANLASMVTGQFSGELFVKLRYNSKISNTLDSEDTDYNFREQLSGSAINHLNLNTLYVITTQSTASASELIINGLNPYIDIIQIGGTTTGKNEASVTLYDSPSFRFDDDGLNPNHTWAIQPLISRTENSEGFSDYTSGLVPDIALPEDLTNMDILGDETEPLLAKAIETITGTAAKSQALQKPAQAFYGSELATPLGNTMYVELKE
ncbi:S41 family peptidase [Galbibacter sp. EGI 63066]|uniref:S41 family peptidase n=1 Tax=Galbibacter sp. EGI 63066 TaxID=2993559 RepID=UPI002248A1B4|nr:S41 family peptidase [Galbibacter sp. EGI 63066]MCX2678532.1 S41 family peptidase [Galbibacter sp. EGI 63066]